MSPEELKEFRRLLDKAIDEEHVWVGEGLLRVCVVRAEYKAKHREVLLRLGRPLEPRR